MRRIAFLLAAGILATATPATAQTSGTGGTTGTTGTTSTTLTAADFTIQIEYKDAAGKWILLRSGTTQFDRFFTRTRCLCNEEIRLRVDIVPASIPKVAQNAAGTVRVLVGSTTDCVSSNGTDRDHAMCFDPAGGGSTKIGDLRSTSYTVPVNMQKLFQPKSATVGPAGCDSVVKQTVYLWVDTTLTGVPDSGLSDMAAPHLQLPIDGEPPPEPSNVKVRRGGEALAVSWDQISGVPDLSGGGFVVFCARGGTLPVFADPQYTGAYDSPAAHCPSGPAANVSDAGVTATVSSALTVTPDADTVAAIPNEYGDDGMQVAPPAPFANIDPAYQCSSLITSATSARIEGLENGVPYVVGVASVDKTGNASPITRAYIQAPIPTRDFYRGYRAAGGQADGGYCAVGGRGSRSLAATAALAAVALLWRRRRRARRQGSAS
jgi:hypothetical protein